MPRLLAIAAIVLCLGALGATLAGFFAAWEVTSASAPGFGSVEIRYGLRSETATAGRQSETSGYFEPGSDASPLLQQTFQIQTMFVAAATALAALALVLAALAPWREFAARAGLAALGILAVLSLVGAGIFWHNFPVTEEGRFDGEREGTFWGSGEGLAWAPGPAWYAEAAAGGLALAALACLWLSARGGSAGSASTGPP